MVKSRTSSRMAVSLSKPIFLSRVTISFSIFLRSSGDLPMSDRAIPLKFDRVVSCLQSSCLFLNPYCPRSLSSSWRMSVRHGNRGVSNFLLCFFGSPKVLFLFSCGCGFGLEVFLFDS